MGTGSQQKQEIAKQRHTTGSTFLDGFCTCCVRVDSKDANA